MHYDGSMHDALLRYLFSPVTRIKGVGPSMASTLANLLPTATQMSGAAFPCIRDLLFHLPHSFIDRRVIYPVGSAPEGVVATCIVVVQAHLPPKTKRFSKQPYRVVCSDDSGELVLTFFGAREDYIQRVLPVGQKRVVSGRIERFDYQLQMSHPDIIAPLTKLDEVQRVEPVYPLTAGLTSRRLASMIDQALASLPELPEWIAPQVFQHHHWPSFRTALEMAHHPQKPEELQPDAPARMRLAYDEMLATQLRLAQARRNMLQQTSPRLLGSGEYTRKVLGHLPFSLTAGQQRVLNEIATDMASGGRMVRLLQGDVGSGKTMVALLAMLKAAEDGYQSVLMAPTEILARQHYENFMSQCRCLHEGGCADVVPSSFIVQLTGSMKAAERKRALEVIASGEAKLIIGTHALFQEGVAFAELALVVVDEQHRFGVAQRVTLAEKGKKPHLLHMTATPIPRSLALTAYGDMDISELKEKPSGRQSVVTRLIPMSRTEEVLNRLQSALERGEKAYWVCPMIDGASSKLEGDAHSQAEDHDLAAAQQRYKEFTARFGPIVGLLHGRMKQPERQQQMQRFVSGDFRLLVATTVVEVGVDVRDATIMVIEHADRFGMAQLHQLRGRVGRGEKPSACVLLYQDAPAAQQFTFPNTPLSEPPALARLSVLRDTQDGFAIAEADLALRGSGEVLGVRQSGKQRFIFFDLANHQQLISEARGEAAQVEKAENASLYAPLLQIFSAAENA